MYIDILDLSDEAIFYLKKLIKDFVDSERSVFLNQSTYQIWTQEYVAPAPTADNSMQEKEAIQPGYANSAAQIYGYFLSAIKYFPSFFMTPATTSTTAAVKPLPGTHCIDIELSHHILINKEANRYHCYLVAKKSLGSGGFGSVFDSPASFVLETKSDDLTFRLTDHIAKNVKVQGTSAAVLREFHHLKLIFPLTELVDVSQTPVNSRDFSSIFAPFLTSDHWIITQKIDGLALDKIKIEELTTPQKLKIALSLMWELYQLHHPELLGGLHIHNDIKPANIIVTKSFDAHYCDFGSATMEDETVPSLTFKYSNPSGFYRPAKKAGDIYSLGITLFQLFLPSKHITEGISRWNMLPKGKNEKLHKALKHNKKDTGLIGLKVLESGSQKKVYQFFHPDTQVLVCDIEGLDKEQQAQLFNILKQMRNGEPLPIEKAYNMLLDLAVHVKDFDINYFSTKQIETDLSIAVNHR